MVALQNEVVQLSQKIEGQQAEIDRYRSIEAEYETIGPLKIVLSNLEQQVSAKQQQIIRLQNQNDELSCEMREISQELE